MTRALRKPAATLACTLALTLLGGCAVQPASQAPGQPASTSANANTGTTGTGTAPATGQAPSPTPTVTTTSLAATVAISPGAKHLAALPDSRKNKARPFTARGVALISKAHPLSKGYVPKLDSRYRLAPEAAKAYGRMVAAAKKAGLTIVWRVGYRSYATQAALYAHPPAVYGKNATQYVAKPGCSEHQAGLAVDVASPRGRGSAFKATKEYKWLRAHAHSYGFILRYPQGKTALTGYRFESWHYRYVGTTVASAFGPNSEMTLEEYVGGR